MKKIDQNINSELQQLCKYIFSKIENCLGSSTLYFEHGESGSTINGGSCNNHAHLHIINSGKEIINYHEKLLEEIQKILFDYNGIKINKDDIFEIDGIVKNSNYLENLKEIIKGGKYYQFGNGEKAFIITNGEKYHKSQLIREAGAKLLEGEKAFYDWKNTPEIIDFLKNGNENNFISLLRNRINNLEKIFIN